VDEKNDQIALRRIVAGREILRNAKIAIRERQVYGQFAWPSLLFQPYTLEYSPESSPFRPVPKLAKTVR